jgi:poly-gamma-glutamate synthesis protein (capsule biosynthesis protein)
MSSDLTYANLEGPVAPEIGGVSGYPQFNYPVQIISDLKNSGFDIVSTANNHALDRGWKGVDKSIQHLRELGLAFTGTRLSSDTNWESWPQAVDLSPFGFAGKKLYFLACTEMLNGGSDPKKQVLHCFEQQDKIRDWVKAVLLKPDVTAVILLPHWGEENRFEISRQRRDWAREMIQAGAIAIIGSHPHVMQKIERLGPGVVAYSLGNFVSNQRAPENRLSLLLQLKLQINQASQKLEIQQVKPLPLWLDRKFEPDGTAKYQLQIIQDFKKFPPQAAEIWKRN